MSASRNWRLYGLKHRLNAKSAGKTRAFLLNGSTPEHQAALSISSAPFVGT